MQLSAAVFALSVASGAYAASHTVQVGADGFAFTPSSLSGVQAGDDVSFEFHAKNHSVTQSTFATPCTFMPGGVNSGFQVVSATDPPPTWDITIKDVSAPLWFYCAQTSPANHCQSGMVFAINPTADKTFAAFQAAASSAIPGPPPPPPSSSLGSPSTQPSSAGTPGTAPPATNSNAPAPSVADPNAATTSSTTDPNASASSPLPSSQVTSATSGTTSGAPASSSTNGTTNDSSVDNGAAGMGVSASGILALVGLVAGLML